MEVTFVTESQIFCAGLLKGKLMLEVFCDWHCIMHYEFIP